MVLTLLTYCRPYESRYNAIILYFCGSDSLYVEQNMPCWFWIFGFLDPNWPAGWAANPIWLYNGYDSFKPTNPANKRHWHNLVLMLCQRRRRWAKIKIRLGQLYCVCWENAIEIDPIFCGGYPGILICRFWMCVWPRNIYYLKLEIAPDMNLHTLNIFPKFHPFVQFCTIISLNSNTTAIADAISSSKSMNICEK